MNLSDFKRLALLVSYWRERIGTNNIEHDYETDKDSRKWREVKNKLFGNGDEKINRGCNRAEKIVLNEVVYSQLSM